MGACCAKAQPIGDLPDGVECLERTPSEVKVASNILANAFAGSAEHAPEAGFDWCLGDELQGRGWDDPRRHDSINWVFRYVVENVFASGHGAVLVCRSDGSAIAGVAALKIYRSKPKDAMCATVTTLRRAGLPSGAAEIFVSSPARPRMKAFEAGLEALHKAHASGPHLYVWGVGVNRLAQGQGVGGKLMRAVVSIADREGLPCYLETTGARNPKIYEKFGFSVVGQTELRTKPKGGAAAEIFDQPYLAMVRARVHH